MAHVEGPLVGPLVGPYYVALVGGSLVVPLVGLLVGPCCVVV